MTTLSVRRPFGISLLVVLSDLGAIAQMLVILLLGGALAASAARLEAGGMVAAAILIYSAIPLLFCVGILVVGHYLWHGYRWARVAFSLLLGAAMLYALHALMGPGSQMVKLLEFAVLGLFLMILQSPAAREWCRR